MNQQRVGSAVAKYQRYLKTSLSFFKYGGIKFVYNYLWLHSFSRNNALMRKIFLQYLFPYTVFHPPFLQLEITTKCNLQCQMCEHTYWKEPMKNMTFEEFQFILDQFPKLKEINFTGIGENFLNPDFMKMVRYTKSKGIYIEMYDPLIFLSNSQLTELIDLRLDKIVLSMDGATKETYEKIRVGADFNKVIKNIKTLMSLKKEKKSFFPQLNVNFVVNKENINEILPFIDLMHELGIKEVIKFISLVHVFKQIQDLATDIPDGLIKKATKKAKEYGMTLSWDNNIPPMHKRKPISDCTNWIMPFIFVTGHVIPCCATSQADKRDFQKGYSFGNIFQTPFKEIWGSKKYKDFRRTLHKGKVPLPCRGCSLFNTSK